MSQIPLQQFDDEQFRKAGYELIDWIADYHKNIEDRPVRSDAKPEDILNSLPDKAPEQAESFDAVLKDVNDLIVPGITHWQSPDFFAFFPCNNSGPSVLGELLSAGLGVQGMLWQTSPACTELEMKVIDWLADLLALPAKFSFKGGGGGVIQDTASSASLVAMLAARHKATGGKAPLGGMDANLVAYTSNQAHSSISKAANISGLGTRNLRLVPSNTFHAMDTGLLDKLIHSDAQAGRKPFFVAATVGTTSSNAMDKLEEIGKICKKYDVWLHVDAAMSGTAAMCPEFRFIHEGLELADSYTFNPHKWMLTNFDCNAFFIADKKMLIDTLSITPEYLRNKASESKNVVDYRDWQVPLGRRFRALKLWFVLRMYGAEAIREMIRSHVSLTQKLADDIDAHPNFEIAAPVPLNLICFRHKDGDEKTRKILEHVNQSGKAYLTHTVLNNTYVIRICVGQAKTTEKHVNQLWKTILEANDLL